MNRALAALVIAAGLFGGCSSQAKDDCMTCCEAPAGVLRHVVMVKFKPGTPPEKIKEIEAAFAALPGQIPTIVGFEGGTNVSPEGHDKGYTHCYVITFADAAGRDAYLPHPAHKKFVDLIGPHLEEVHVLDYVANAKKK